MLTESGRAKLGDFGISGEVKDYTKHHTAIGTPYWMAPEVITENYDQRVRLFIVLNFFNSDVALPLLFLL